MKHFTLKRNTFLTTATLKPDTCTHLHTCTPAHLHTCTPAHMHTRSFSLTFTPTAHPPHNTCTPVHPTFTQVHAAMKKAGVVGMFGAAGGAFKMSKEDKEEAEKKAMKNDDRYKTTNEEALYFFGKDK